MYAPPKTNVEHRFDLSGCRQGDEFLGCPSCWWRLQPGEVANPVCPECRGKLNRYTVTESDMKGSKPCDYCGEDGRVETDNNGPIGPCPICGGTKNLA